MHPSPGQMLAQDAADTVRRIRRDVSHMKSLGKLAIAGIRAVAADARAKVERGIDQAADIIEAARTTPRGKRF